MLFAGCDFLFDFGGSSEPSVSGDDSNTLFGYPSEARAGESQLIEHESYTLLFSYDDLTPLWVSWHIDSGDLGTGRTDGFVRDPDLKPEYQLTQDDYDCDVIGFDRGHMCPNADRNGNTTLQKQTFYMSNIVPQNPFNNQQTWQDLEEFLQGLAENNSEVYIIAGPAGVGGVNEYGDEMSSFEVEVGSKEIKEVTVPKYVWKVALIMDDDNNDFERVGEIGGCDPLAVIMPNEDTTDHEWTYYIKTIDDVERLTGFDFFSALDDSIEADIESEKFDYKKF